MHAARQILKIDLMHDAKAWRYHAEGIKGLHAPFHELVALVVALKFQLHVEVQRIFFTVVIDHDGVVNDQINRHQRLDALRIPPQPSGHAAHGGQVGKQRDAGEVLQHHA